MVERDSDYKFYVMSYDTFQHLVTVMDRVEEISELHSWPTSFAVDAFNGILEHTEGFDDIACGYGRSSLDNRKDN